MQAVRGGGALILKKGPRGQPPSMDETDVRDWEDGWSQEARHCSSTGTELAFCAKTSHTRVLCQVSRSRRGLEKTFQI